MDNRNANSIVGWQYPEPTIRRYLQSERTPLLTLDFDFPSQNKCNLRCKYCFIQSDEREAEAKNGSTDTKLSLDALIRVFGEAAQIGSRSAKMVGDQEPFQEPGVLEFLRFASEKLAMWIVVFTNGTVLADDEVCRRIHGLDGRSLIAELSKLRISIMVKFHSFSDKVEDDLVQSPGYAAKRNEALNRLIEARLNDVPLFRTAEEQLTMTGCGAGETAGTWTRLGLESVLTPQCMDDIYGIYRLKSDRRLFVDLDPPVPVGLTRSLEWRDRLGLSVPKETALDACLRIYELNEELGIPFVGASPYFGSFPCSQLPYGLYVNARGRIYPCCGCPAKDATGRSEYLGNARVTGALRCAIDSNPYRLHYRQHGFAYDTAPFSSPAYPGYGIYHGCPYRDRAGDVMPENWETIVEEHVERLRAGTPATHPETVGT